MVNLYRENIKTIKGIVEEINGNKNNIGKDNEILKFELEIELNKLEGKLLANYIDNVNECDYSSLSEVELLKLNFIIMKFMMISNEKYFMKDLLNEIEEVIAYSGKR